MSICTKVMSVSSISSVSEDECSDTPRAQRFECM